MAAYVFGNRQISIMILSRQCEQENVRSLREKNFPLRGVNFPLKDWSNWRLEMMDIGTGPEQRGLVKNIYSM